MNKSFTNENKNSKIIHYIKKMNGEIILDHKTNGTLEAYKNAIDENIKDLKSLIGKCGLLDVEDTKWSNKIENGIIYLCRSYNLVYEEYVDEFYLLLYEE